MARPTTRGNTQNRRQAFRPTAATVLVAWAMIASSSQRSSSRNVAFALLASPSLGSGRRSTGGSVVGRRWQGRDQCRHGRRCGPVAASCASSNGRASSGRCDERGTSFSSPPLSLRPSFSSGLSAMLLTRPRSCATPLQMCQNSRELRFYSHSSEVPIARVGEGASRDTTTVTTAMSSTTTTTTTTQSTTTTESQTTTTMSTITSIGSQGASGILDSLTGPVGSIYHSGLAGLVNSFDSDYKRAFSLPVVTGNQKVWSASAQYSTSSGLFSSAKGGAEKSDSKQQQQRQQSGGEDGDPKTDADHIRITLTDEEQELFDLLRDVTTETGMKSTLRVAGGWVRDKILATPEFHERRRGVESDSCGAVDPNNPSDAERMKRITSKFKGEKGDSSSPESFACFQPVDIDIALDDKLGREFADELNSWLSDHGRETHSVGVVLKNPEKSKHLETATMRVNNYWIDFVNLRAEEYTSDSRIPDLMRIGTAEEDAFRRDLTINSLFYNINDGRVEDMTGRGLEDLRMGIVQTPLPPLTTLLDDPLRVLRSIRFAARLRFGMAQSLREAAADARVRTALAQKVSRERVGSEVDLMLKSRDPVGAMRLLVNLGLVVIVFPLPDEVGNKSDKQGTPAVDGSEDGVHGSTDEVFHQGLNLLSHTHDHLCECKSKPPVWCQAKRALKAGAVNGVGEADTRLLTDDNDARRLLWYAAFLKPLRDRSIRGLSDEEVENKKKPRKANRSVTIKLLVDELKRPGRDAEAVEKIMKAADGFTKLVMSGSDQSALSILLSGARVVHSKQGYQYAEGDSESRISTTMNNKVVDPNKEDDPVWSHCMEFRLGCAKILKDIGPLWRASLILSLSEQLIETGDGEFEYAIEGDTVYETQEEIREGIIHKYDAFAAAIMQLGLIGIWQQKPLINGDEIIKSVLPNITMGPVFREVMQVQADWMTTHPGGEKDCLVDHLRVAFPDFV